MKMTDLQFAALTISLSTLGQVDLSDNDPELLGALAYLLEEASDNVARALAPADLGHVAERQIANAAAMARRFAALNAGPGEETTE